jgi:K+ transporter
MRFYIEYLYLILMIMAIVFLAMEFEGLRENGTLYPILIATGLFAFMYVFRRAQRIKLDQYMEEREKELEEAADGTKEETTNESSD